MLRWKHDALHAELCGLTLANVREENEEELLALQEEEDDDKKKRDVLLCLSPERVQSPADSSLGSSCGSPQPSSPVELNLPEDIQQLLYEDVSPKSRRRRLHTSISLIDRTEEDGPEHNAAAEPPSQPNDLVEDSNFPHFGSVFTPWMCVFDLDAACGVAGTDQSSSDEDRGGSDQQQQSFERSSASSAPVPKQPLHLQSQQSSKWFDDIQAGVPNAMNQLFGCLDPEYGRVMTINEETTVRDSHFSSALPDARLLLRPIPTNPDTTTPSTSPPPLLPCQYFTNFATEHNIETIYVPVCVGSLAPCLVPPFRLDCASRMLQNSHKALCYYFSNISPTPFSFRHVESQTEDAGAAAAAAAGGGGGEKGAVPRRRAPQAAASMSLPPDAAAALNKKIAHKPHSGSRSETAVTSDAAQELIQVKTPGADRSALKDLPALRDAPPTKREELFVMKLKLCSVIFSFDDPTADKRGKDMKRQTLLELVDYVNTPAGQKIFTEACMGDLMAMVSANVCRALPPATDDFDPEVRSMICVFVVSELCLLCVRDSPLFVLFCCPTGG